MRYKLFSTTIITPLIIACFLLLSVNESFANDSTNHPTATGIEFVKNDDISIEKETLFLGKRSVKVEYEFYNHTEREVSVNMAFPLPEISMDSMWFGEPKTWDFRVYINNKKYRNVKLQWRALVGGVDKAQLLERLGISVYQPLYGTEQILDGEYIRPTECLSYSLKKDDQELLLREGLIIGLGEEGICFQPQWNAQATYLWEAKFPPKKKTKVKHTYNQRPGFWHCNPQETGTTGYDCQSNGDEMNKARKMFGPVPIVHFFYEYVLHTGGNWRGPIKKFKFKAQGTKDSFAWVKAPFPVKRRSDNTLTADLVNFKPLSRPEAEEQFRKGSPEIDNGLIWFNYVKKPTDNMWREIIDIE